MALLQQLNQEGATIVMVTHAPEHIIYGTRVIELLDGKVVNDQLVKEKANDNTSHIINDVGSTEIAKTKQMSAEVTCG